MFFSNIQLKKRELLDEKDPGKWFFSVRHTYTSSEIIKTDIKPCIFFIKL